VSSDTDAAAELLRTIARDFPAIGGPQPPTRAELQRALGAASSWQLVDPRAVPGYEDAVARGQIPTRDGSWHDAFNLLAFMAWPRAKAALHARVLRCQGQRRTQGEKRRSREEDALALVDEVALVVSGPAELVARFDTHRSVSVLQSASGPGTDPVALAGMGAAVHEGLRVRWFGHALLEHLALRRPQVTAGVWTLVLEPGVTDDEALAAQIEAGQFTAPCVSPGVPWPHAQVLAWVEARAYSTRTPFQKAT